MLADNSHDIVTALCTRREYSKALLHLAQEQQILIEQDRLTDLIQVIAKKQRVIGLMDDLGQAHSGLGVWWRLTRDSLPTETRSRCEAIITETERLLAQTLAQEQSGTDVLSERRNDTQRELMELGEVIQERRTRGTRAPAPQLLDVSR